VNLRKKIEFSVYGLERIVLWSSSVTDKLISQVLLDLHFWHASYCSFLCITSSCHLAEEKKQASIIDSAPSIGVYYFLSLTLVCLSIRLSVCVCVFVTLLSRSFKLIFLFCFWMELSHFWPSVLHVALYKTLFFNFDLGPLTPKIYSQKFGTKSL